MNAVTVNINKVVGEVTTPLNTSHIKSVEEGMDFGQAEILKSTDPFEVITLDYVIGDKPSGVRFSFCKTETTLLISMNGLPFMDKLL